MKSLVLRLKNPPPIPQNIGGKFYGSDSRDFARKGLGEIEGLITTIYKSLFILSLVTNSRDKSKRKKGK